MTELKIGMKKVNFDWPKLSLPISINKFHEYNLPSLKITLEMNIMNLEAYKCLRY